MGDKVGVRVGLGVFVPVGLCVGVDVHEPGAQIGVAVRVGDKVGVGT